MKDMIYRQAAIDALEKDKVILDLIVTRMSADNPQLDHYVTMRNQVVYDINTIEHVPPVYPEQKKMTSKEWVDFLVDQFDVSRTTAKGMLHGLMRGKAEDNFKKQFSGGKKLI